jgi:hypothetical protein
MMGNMNTHPSEQLDTFDSAVPNQGISKSTLNEALTWSRQHTTIGNPRQLRRAKILHYSANTTPSDTD